MKENVAVTDATVRTSLDDARDRVGDAGAADTQAVVAGYSALVRAMARKTTHPADARRRERDGRAEFNGKR